MALSFRERNNASRRKCYEKKKLNEEIKKEAASYERYMIEYHIEQTNDTTYIWKDIPDEWLFESGYIHNYNTIRKLRILKNKGRIGEYGLDGMTYNKTLQCYQGLQAKHYGENAILTAEHLGSFLSTVMTMYTKSNKTAGILYHTCALQRDFEHNIKQTSQFVQAIKLPSNNSATVITPKKKIELRPYQISAINNCFESNKGIFLTRMACGTGKTTIFSELAKHYNKIICISPLKNYVEQNHTCISNTISTDIETKIFDSDNGHINEDEIMHFLNKDKYLISTTFKTGRETFSNLVTTYNNVLCIIDEAHNLTHDDNIWELAEKIDNTHLFTATKTNCIYDRNIQEINTLPLGEAIKQKLVCDYQIYLPLIINGEVSIDYDENEMYEKSDIETKVMFLLKGMLLKGSKRCIVYLTLTSEIKKYEETIIQKAQTFHGVKVNTFKIHNGINKHERKYTLDEFEKEVGNDEINVVFSIRILDECVNIPPCDSVFITNVSEHTSEMRTV